MAMDDSGTPADSSGAVPAGTVTGTGVEGYTTHVDDTDDEDITGGLSPDRTGGSGGYTSRRPEQVG